MWQILETLQTGIQLDVEVDLSVTRRRNEGNVRGRRSEVSSTNKNVRNQRLICLTNLISGSFNVL